MEAYSLAIREGLRNFCRARTLSIALSGCISVAVFALGALALVAVNVNSVLEKWESKVEVVAFLSHDASEAQAQVILERIRSNPQVGEARLVAGRRAWEEFFSEAGTSLDIGEIPLEGVLPDSVIVRMAPGDRDIAAIRGIASDIASLEKVEDVKFEKVLIERYMRFREELAAFTVATCVFWIIVFGIISAGIAGLASTARNSEVRTLRTLGASRRFVRRVFMVEGAAQGLAGSIIGSTVLLAAAALVSRRMDSGVWLPAQLFVACFAVGPALGLFSGFFLLRRALAAVFVLLLIVGPTLTTAANAAGALDDEIARHEKELSQLENRLRESLDKSKALEEKEVAVIDEVEELDKELESLAREIEKSETNMAANNTAAEKAAAELAICESELDGSRKNLGRWLKLLCNQREPTLVEVILHDMPQSRMTIRREILSRLAREKAKSVERIESLWQDYSAREKVLSKRLEIDRQYTEGIRRRAQQSNENKKKREAVLARLQERKSIYAAVIKDLDVSAKRLESMIESQREEDSGIFAESVPFRDMKGLLPWPTDGEIMATFGRTKNPESNTYTRHRGLDFSAPAGSLIRAVHDASVAYCDWFRGYGKLVILSHGGGYSSVYAHCSEISVQKGDLVRAGQPIAFVGETGSLKGPFLYFEVRENGRPVDPSLWLQRRNLHATQQQ